MFESGGMNRYISARILILPVLILFQLTLTRCSKDNDNAANVSSRLCSNVKGMEAIYWDLMNGIPRGDIPGGVPTIKTVGGTYSHPAHPSLGFTYPAGYVPQTDPTQGSLGVNVFRQDNRSIWRYTYITINGTVDPQQVADGEVNALQQFFGTNNASIQTVCSEKSSITPVSGIVQNTSSALIRFGSFSALVHVGVTSVAATGTSMITISLSSAPTAEFSSEIQGTYLPIAWQMLFTGGGSLDRDGDGFPDSEDRYPDDPTRH